MPKTTNGEKGTLRMAVTILPENLEAWRIHCKAPKDNAGYGNGR